VVEVAGAALLRRDRAGTDDAKRGDESGDVGAISHAIAIEIALQAGGGDIAAPGGDEHVVDGDFHRRIYARISGAKTNTHVGGERQQWVDAELNELPGTAAAGQRGGLCPGCAAVAGHLKRDLVVGDVTVVEPDPSLRLGGDEGGEIQRRRGEAGRAAVE